LGAVDFVDLGGADEELIDVSHLLRG